jgi:hypothetical protein
MCFGTGLKDCVVGGGGFTPNLVFCFDQNKSPGLYIILSIKYSLAHLSPSDEVCTQVLSDLNMPFRTVFPRSSSEHCLQHVPRNSAPKCCSERPCLEQPTIYKTAVWIVAMGQPGMTKSDFLTNINSDSESSLL